jgi:anti-sigma regulatory factor (Ser/Thr protein kinase)/Fe-S-cluster-containing hydrogenase component 2
MEFISYDIVSDDFHRAGAASRAIKEHLKRIGADAEAIRRTMIAAYEAEMNVVIHSVGGRLEASLTESQIDVNVVDDGPGIPDVEQAMVEGFSTAGAEARALGFGAGMGLPNIRRSSDRLRITSKMDEGTRVSFTVSLKPESTRAARPISLYASADRCRDCRACLSACPTQAMRVRDGRPSVLEHLCIDCAACIAACGSRALVMRDEISSLDDLKAKNDMLLVVPPALLAGCGADYPPAQVLAALRGLGFAGVITSEPYERALREAAAGAAGTAEAAGAAGAAGAAPKPVIVPSCPAIVNLVELRFPSLVPHLAPFDSPWEAVQAGCGDRPVTYVVSCPSQRSALLVHAPASAEAAAGTRGRAPAQAPTRIEYIAPEVVRQAVMVKLTGGGASSGGDGTPAAAEDPAAADEGATATVPANTSAEAPLDGLLTITGTDHVITVLEAIENGLLDDVNVIDPYACEGGCFGSPLLSEDYHVAARRWSRGRAAVESAGAGAVGGAARAGAPGGAAARRRPFAARPGIRLDADMSRAIEKLGRMQAVIRSLPGRDCGACGAPTCAALSEDVVMERAGVDLCPYAAPDNSEKEVRDR